MYIVSSVHFTSLHVLSPHFNYFTSFHFTSFSKVFVLRIYNVGTSDCTVQIQADTVYANLTVGSKKYLLVIKLKADTQNNKFNTQYK
jgi:hypothetical protein